MCVIIAIGEYVDSGLLPGMWHLAGEIRRRYEHRHQVGAYQVETPLLRFTLSSKRWG